MTEAPTSAPVQLAREVPSRLAYQPGLDGIRAVAIVLVMVFHFSWNGHAIVYGGFLGVDAFFVLSGFLITTLLLQEHRRASRVSLRHFYARRALRLLPLAAVLVGAGIVLWHVVPTEVGSPDRLGIVGTAFYFANWVRIWQPGSLGILGHAWSLSIEEQFYLVWPTVLVVLLARGARARFLTAFTATGVLAAAAWRTLHWMSVYHTTDRSFVDYYLTVTGRHPVAVNPFGHRAKVWDRLYFSSFTRADALLLGCLVAVLLFFWGAQLGAPARRLLGIASLLGAAGFAVVVSQARVFVSGWLPAWGLLAFELSVAAMIGGVMLVPTGPLNRLLSLAPFVWLGRRSYGIYIIHWPVIVLVENHTHLGNVPRLVLSLGLAIGLAALSFRFFEAPILKLKDRFQGGLRAAPAPST